MPKYHYLHETEYEKDLVDALKQWGWKEGKASLYSPPYGLPIWEDEFRKNFARINNIDSFALKRIIEEVYRKFSTVLANVSENAGEKDSKTVLDAQSDFLAFLRNGIVIDDKRYHLIDFANPYNNSLIAVRQVSLHKEKRPQEIPDIILFVNGIPLVDIELKNPKGEEDSLLQEAYYQIQEYQQTYPDLYTFIQIGVISDSPYGETIKPARYFPTAPGVYKEIVDINKETWQWDTKIILPDGEVKDIDQPLLSYLGFLYPPTFLDLVKHYIYVHYDIGKKIVAKYMQYRAASRLVSKVYNYRLNPTEERASGVVWHWQGSGKTFTMAFAGMKLLTTTLPNGSPLARTVLYVVDRESLGNQFTREIKSLKPNVGLDALITVMTSIRHLAETLKKDKCRGQRGQIITLVHKFDEGTEAFENLKTYCKRVKEEEGMSTIMEATDITIMIDEAHRNQAGKRGKFMRRLFTKAPMFAFTGTIKIAPGTDKDTLSIFGELIDIYSMSDSIRDGATLPIVLKDRIPRLTHIDSAILEQAYEQIKKEIEQKGMDNVEEITSSVAEKMKIVDVLTMDKRMKIVAEDVATHFLSEVNEKFKGMLVAPSREAAAKYRFLLVDAFRKVIEEQKLDIDFTEDWIEAVFTAGSPAHEQGYIRKYLLDVQERYGVPYSEMSSKFEDNFRGDYSRSPNPRLVVVTDKLLTGYNVPVLGIMYLDKFMTNGQLLQALARTNRPYPYKEAGIVFDYVGILKNLEQALLLYGKFDDLSVSFKSVEDLLNDFYALWDDLQLHLEKIAFSDEEFLSEDLLLSLSPTEEQEIRKMLITRLRSQKRMYGPEDEEYRNWKHVALLARKINNIVDTLHRVAKHQIKEQDDIKRACKIVRFLILVDRALRKKTVSPDVIRNVKNMVVKPMLEEYGPDFDIEEPQETPEFVIDNEAISNLLKEMEKAKSIGANVVTNKLEFTDKKLIRQVDFVLRTMINDKRTPVTLQEKIIELYKRLKSASELYMDANIREEVKNLLHQYEKAQQERERLGLSIGDYQIYSQLKEYFPSMSIDTKENMDRFKQLCTAIRTSSPKRLAQEIVTNLQWLGHDSLKHLKERYPGVSLPKILQGIAEELKEIAEQYSNEDEQENE